MHPAQAGAEQRRPSPPGALAQLLRRVMSERYVRCGQPECDDRHWGAFGAAGILLIRRGSSTTNTPTVLLQHRGRGTDHGGTWAHPGGALEEDETPTAGALREAWEETGLPRNCMAGGDPLVRILQEVATLDHGGWKYITILAELRRPWEPEIPVDDPESLELAWVPVGDVERLPLHPAFEEAWPELRSRIVKEFRP